MLHVGRTGALKAGSTYQHAGQCSVRL